MLYPWSDGCVGTAHQTNQIVARWSRGSRARRATLRIEQFAARGVDDRRDSRVTNATFDRDREEFLDDGVDLPDGSEFVFGLQLVLQHRRREEQAAAFAPERECHRAIVE